MLYFVHEKGVLILVLLHKDNKLLSTYRKIIVKQNCFWKIVVRRMQDVRSMASINPYAEEKEHFLFAYDAPMVSQIHFCLTNKIRKGISMELL